ncbi:hypothetical protein HNP84_010369 [Thermocatellispora tengchongensis]|uniref:DUF2092 domain-containing protein n=1 Tax=Thermocatellispora tengchongensis TaxID=1073253 RepID=A0A840PNV7_9ACTN|nr:hypothetical protein [Thermocatellispora tengchongensis]MBB5140599.1 hypothetical protein [Thermocatellispora tengchongensis]
MRRLIAVLAAALIAPALATATPASAQAAAPVDPAKALKKYVSPGYGVKFTEVSRLAGNGETLIALKSNGAYQFGKGKPAAADVSFRYQLDPELKELLRESDEFKDTANAEIDPLKALTSTTRVIQLKGKTYFTNPEYTNVLPDGKTWVTGKAAEDMEIPNTQPVDALDPTTVKNLLAGVSGKPGGVVNGARTTVYSGKITLAQLYKLSPSYRTKFGKPTGSSAKSKISWKIWFDGKGLPRRVLATNTEKIGSTTLTDSTDTRYSDWGRGTYVKAPPAAQIVDENAVEQELPELPTEFNPIQ